MVDRPDGPPLDPLSSGALSMAELRRQLIRRSSELAVRARTLRGRGHTAAAVRLEARARDLRRTAKEMAQDNSSATPPAE
jgi:hypothetical protein